jgi:hypothetical protein
MQSCVKDISLDLPPYEPKIVVEGRIEPGVPPFVLLSNSLNLYASTSISDLENNFITDAQVFVNNGVDTIQLDLFCTSTLPPQLIPIVAELLGYTEQELQNINICAYSTLDPNWLGTIGTTYNLEIHHQGEVFNSTTQIKIPTPLDSVYWSERPNLPGWGFMSATLTDPAGPGDAYRWESKRLNHYSDGTEKDPNFLAPFNSAFDDQFFDGIQFSFYYDNPGSYDDSTISSANQGYYALGDTVVVKWSTIDYSVYEFLRYEDTQIANGGSPFASPVNIPSNVSNNALGLWAGFSPSFDTIICAN